METENSNVRSASYEGFIKVINHLLFGTLDTPSFKDDEQILLNTELINFIPKKASAEKMNLMFEFYSDIFEDFTDKFLRDCENVDNSKENRSYSNHPAAKNMDLLLRGAVYHTDLIRYEKKDNGQALSILFVNTEDNKVEYLTYHTLHFVEIVKFIKYKQKSISSEDYERILNHYNSIILKQYIGFLIRK